MKVTANGKTFNFPDGTPQEEIGAAVDEYFSGGSQSPESPSGLDRVLGSVAGMVQQGADMMPLEQIRQSLPSAKPEIPSDVPLPFGMTRADIEAANKRNIDTNRIIEDIRTNPEALLAYKQAQDESTGEAIGRAAGSEFSALGAGVSELIDKHLPEPLSNVLNYRLGGDNLGTPQERMDQRAIDMAEQNLTRNVRSVASPVASTVGATLPYIATDIALSPVTNAILSTASKGIGTVGKSALRGTEALESSLKSSGSSLAREAGELVSPVTRIGQNIEARPPLSPETSAAYKELARAPLTGAIEGAAGYNTTAEQGAISSMLGQLASMGPMKSVLGRTEKKLSKSENQILDTMERRGYRATPGMRTGNKRLQAKEQGFRSEARFRDYMDEYDTANKKVVGNFAAKAMGFVDDFGKHDDFAKDLTPQTLSSHMDSLSSQYKSLEANTIGKYGPKQIREVGNVLKNLQPTANRNTSPVDMQRYQIAKSYTDELQAEMSTPQRSPTGKFQGYRFDGSQYQALRQRLQDDIGQAFSNGDNRLGTSLRKIQSTLDDSLTSGMDNATAKQWKDLNERYAMTRFVMENGMDALGGIDPNKLSNALMSNNEVVRTLTGKGGRIKELQDIARINEMQRRQAGSEGWSGSGVTGDESGKQSLIKSTMSTPLMTRIPMSTRAGMNMYMSGYPSVTGLTGLPKPAIGKISRAQEQGSGTFEALAGGATDTAKSAYDQLMDLIGR